jgi:hypothetical protein
MLRDLQQGYVNGAVVEYENQLQAAYDYLEGADDERAV